MTRPIFDCILDLVARGEVVIEEIMTGKHGTKFIHEGPYAAAVVIEWLESETGWSPYLSLQDAQKLDEVRDALRRGDFERAGRLARIYQLTPLEV